MLDSYQWNSSYLYSFLILPPFLMYESSLTEPKPKVYISVLIEIGPQPIIGTWASPLQILFPPGKFIYTYLGEVSRTGYFLYSLTIHAALGHGPELAFSTTKDLEREYLERYALD